eukprot:symbB.v1.2.035035.t2/scaffold4635.1/size37084/4
MLRRLPELWEMSGPPISVGDAATCSGVLKKVFIHCDTVNDLVTNFLFTKLDRNVLAAEQVLTVAKQKYPLKRHVDMCFTWCYSSELCLSLRFASSVLWQRSTPWQFVA